jgi:predicted O-methyltransferase YrrM
MVCDVRKSRDPACCHCCGVTFDSGDKPELVGAVLQRLSDGGSVTARSDGSTHTPFPIAIPFSEGEGLRAWVKAENCRRTIEIGLAYGVSTLFICQGLIANAGSEGRHVALDPYQHDGFAGVGLQLLEDAGVREIVDHRDGRSELVLPELLAAGEHFDLAFVDANHHFDNVLVDLFYLRQLVDPGKLIVLDDYQLPSVARAVTFFVRNYDWTIEQATTSPDHHWIVLRTNPDPPDRPFGHFIDF